MLTVTIDIVRRGACVANLDHEIGFLADQDFARSGCLDAEHRAFGREQHTGRRRRLTDLRRRRLARFVGPRGCRMALDVCIVRFFGRRVRGFFFVRGLGGVGFQRRRFVSPLRWPVPRRRAPTARWPRAVRRGIVWTLLPTSRPEIPRESRRRNCRSSVPRSKFLVRRRRSPAKRPAEQSSDAEVSAGLASRGRRQSHRKSSVRDESASLAPAGGLRLQVRGRHDVATRRNRHIRRRQTRLAARAFAIGVAVRCCGTALSGRGRRVTLRVACTSAFFSSLRSEPNRSRRNRSNRSLRLFVRRGGGASSS